MFSPGFEMFLSFPSEKGQRVLHPAKVTAVTDAVITAAFEEPGVKLQPGDDAMVFFERQGTFMQQPGRIELVACDQPQPAIAFRLEGQAASAESRQCYRVGTVLTDFNVELNKERDCKVVDVSVDGCAVLSAKSYSTGQAVTMQFVHEGKSYSGQARVQSVREMAPGRFRYGLLCVRDPRNPADLSKGLRQVTMTMQRLQARRLRGAG